MRTAGRIQHILSATILILRYWRWNIHRWYPGNWIICRSRWIPCRAWTSFRKFKTVWNNQWEPSTKRQDASAIYCHRFGFSGHSNVDISTVDVGEIPDADILVGGFPCQDYSVATSLKRSGALKARKASYGGKYTASYATIPTLLGF